jgi:CRP/FNR family cyclic AMP-dependent transcriptional regulator
MLRKTIGPICATSSSAACFASANLPSMLAVFYIKDGKVKLTVVSKTGKEATIGVLNQGDFFGEGCLTGQPLRLCSATAMTDCSVMVEVLHREHEFSDMFVAYLLTRNIRCEEDLVDQLFNSSEKRLARILLLLAHFGKDGKPEIVIPKISQESLAEMVGTTRSRVSFFMNRFRKLGFIDYGHLGGSKITQEDSGRSAMLERSCTTLSAPCRTSVMLSRVCSPGDNLLIGAYCPE